MAKLDEITRESWILSTFPEWGTWLNEEIEETKVEPGKVAMWWLGNMGLWVKTEGNANICMDLWVATGKRTGKNKLMKPKHQHQRAVGCVALQPNLRTTPCVIDPFAIKELDALMATHSHSDHIDQNVAAAVLQNCPEAKFIGPKTCTDIWRKWGVPEEKLVTVRPGDVVTVKDAKIRALESFDRTMLLTVAEDVVLKDKLLKTYNPETDSLRFYHLGSKWRRKVEHHGAKPTVDVFKDTLIV